MVKRLFTTTFAILLCIGALAQGVDFRQITFSEALRQSEAEKKPIFLDCYTDWCGPCKYMTDNVFTLKEAGDYFNNRFVSIKIDMEKGEGVDIAKKYGIKAFPTFLIINHDDEEQHRVVGGGNLPDFISRIEAGIKIEKSFDVLASEYESGKITKKDLTSYWLLVRSGGRENREKIGEIGDRLYAMLSKDDKLEAVYWTLVRDAASSPVGEGMDFILTNRRTLGKSNGEDLVDNFISQSFSQALIQMIVNRIEPEQVEQLPEIVARLESLDVESRDELLILAQMAHARAQGDADAYIAILQQKYSQLSDIHLQNAFFGTNTLVAGNDAKKYYIRLRDLALEIMDNTETGDNNQYLTHLAANYLRKSKVGVYWEDFDSLEDALVQAGKEHKRVFLDCYTTRCDTCEYMTNSVFTREKVGDFLNERFINIKIDMEKGEGLAITRRFGVSACPTFVIIDPDGSMRHIIIGVCQEDALIEKVKEAFDDNKALGAQNDKLKGVE